MLSRLNKIVNDFFDGDDDFSISEIALTFDQVDFVGKNHTCMYSHFMSQQNMPNQHKQPGKWNPCKVDHTEARDSLFARQSFWSFVVILIRGRHAEDRLHPTDPSTILEP